MFLLAIIVAEVAFWVFLLSGLLARYALSLPRLGAILLYSTPLIDLVLLVLTYIDLSHGGEANFHHGISAMYIGFTLLFGPAVVRSMDARIAWKFGASYTSGADTSSPAQQLALWYRCLAASGISAVLLLAGIGVVGLEGAFWLIYWLVVTVSIVILWWFIGPWLAGRRAEPKRNSKDDTR